MLQLRKIEQSVSMELETDPFCFFLDLKLVEALALEASAFFGAILLA